MIEAISGSLTLAAALYLLRAMFLGLRRSRDNTMETFFFSAPTRWETEAAKRWLRSELAPHA